MLFFCLFFGDDSTSTCPLSADGLPNSSPPLTAFCGVELELPNANTGEVELPPTLAAELIGAKLNSEPLTLDAPKLNTDEERSVLRLPMKQPMPVDDDEVTEAVAVVAAIGSVVLVPKVKAVGAGADDSELLPKLNFMGAADEDVTEEVAAVPVALPNVNPSVAFTPNVNVDFADLSDSPNNDEPKAD